MTVPRRMRDRLLLKLAVGALAAGWMVTVLGAQSVPVEHRAAGADTGAELYRIAGTLTDSATGKPVSGATVETLTSGMLQILQNTVTDSEGYFSLDCVPAGKYALRALKRGYVPEAFNEHDGGFSSAIVTGEGQDTEHIPFRIDPEGVIRGHVTDDAGEPVPNAQVLIQRWTASNGLGEHLEAVLTDEVDDQGEFEVWNLSPGKYMLAAKASPWFAVHSSANTRKPADSAEQREAETALDIAYPVTYYDRTTSGRSATPLSLASGETAEVNFSLHAVPAVHLTLRVPHNGDPFPAWATLKQTILGADLRESPDVVSSSESLIEYAVAPGHYVVEGGTPAHVAEVDAVRDLELNLASGTPTIQESVKIRMVDGLPIPEPLQLALLSGDQMQEIIKAQMVGKSEETFPSIPPGEWTAVASSENLQLAVVAVQSGSKLKAGSQIEVTGKESDLTFYIARGKTRIEGLATRDGKGEAGVMIVLVPKDPAVNLAEFRRDQSDSDGSFMLPDLIPGDYIIVAIEDGWGLEWMRTQTIRKYLAGGIAITVSDKGGPLIKLTTPVPVQVR